MRTITLSDQQWQKILPFYALIQTLMLDKRVNAESFSKPSCGSLAEGAQWRLLPKEYGDWNTVYKRFARWNEQGVFNSFISHSQMMPIWNTCSLTQLLSAPTVLGWRAKKAAAKRRKR
jgi:transposase